MLTLVPFVSGHVLDLNVGIGDWVFKFASAYPELNVTSIGSPEQKHSLPTQLPSNLFLRLTILLRNGISDPNTTTSSV